MKILLLDTLKLYRIVHFNKCEITQPSRYEDKSDHLHDQP